MDIRNNLFDFLGWKKLIFKVYLLCDFINIIFWNDKIVKMGNRFVIVKDYW